MPGMSPQTIPTVFVRLHVPIIDLVRADAIEHLLGRIPQERLSGKWIQGLFRQVFRNHGMDAARELPGFQFCNPCGDETFEGGRFESALKGCIPLCTRDREDRAGSRIPIDRSRGRSRASCGGQASISRDLERGRVAAPVLGCSSKRLKRWGEKALVHRTIAGDRNSRAVRSRKGQFHGQTGYTCGDRPRYRKASSPTSSKGTEGRSRLSSDEEKSKSRCFRAVGANLADDRNRFLLRYQCVDTQVSGDWFASVGDPDCIEQPSQRPGGQSFPPERANRLSGIVLLPGPTDENRGCNPRGATRRYRMQLSPPTFRNSYFG